jgi:hypothetical protein
MKVVFVLALASAVSVLAQGTTATSCPTQVATAVRLIALHEYVTLT